MINCVPVFGSERCRIAVATKIEPLPWRRNGKMLQDTEIGGYEIKLIRELVGLNASTLNVCQWAVELQVY